MKHRIKLTPSQYRAFAHDHEEIAALQSEAAQMRKRAADLEQAAQSRIKLSSRHVAAVIESVGFDPQEYQARLSPDGSFALILTPKE